MIAVDTNILVYAHRRDSVWHTPASAAIKELAQSGRPWAIPWHCFFEFLSIVTHPKIYKPPTPIRQALQQVSFWQESPTLVTIGENESFWETFCKLAGDSCCSGGMVYDAKIAGICIASGVRALWTADTDFNRFPLLKTANPLLGNKKYEGKV